MEGGGQAAVCGRGAIGLDDDDACRASSRSFSWIASSRMRFCEPSSSPRVRAMSYRSLISRCRKLRGKGKGSEGRFSPACHRNNPLTQLPRRPSHSNPRSDEG